MEQETFHDKLKNKMDAYAHKVYAITKSFPRDELYGVVSQLRRAALSVILNYIEGYARKGDKVHRNFLQISYGSLKESKYLLHFSLIEGYCLIPLQLKAHFPNQLKLFELQIAPDKIFL